MKAVTASCKLEGISLKLVIPFAAFSVTSLMPEAALFSFGTFTTIKASAWFSQELADRWMAVLTFFISCWYRSPAGSIFTSLTWSRLVSSPSERNIYDKVLVQEPSLMSDLSLMDSKWFFSEPTTSREFSYATKANRTFTCGTPSRASSLETSLKSNEAVNADWQLKWCPASDVTCGRSRATSTTTFPITSDVPAQVSSFTRSLRVMNKFQQVLLTRIVG